jgi:hypothetical protein
MSFYYSIRDKSYVVKKIWPIKRGKNNRETIINIIKQRIMDEMVGRWQISKPITKNSDRSVNLVGGKKTYFKAGNKYFRPHTITQKDAEILA